MMTFESEYRRQAIRALQAGRREAAAELASDAKPYKRAFAGLFGRLHTVTAPFLGPSNRPLR